MWLAVPSGRARADPVHSWSLSGAVSVLRSCSWRPQLHCPELQALLEPAGYWPHWSRPAQAFPSLHLSWGAHSAQGQEQTHFPIPLNLAPFIPAFFWAEKFPSFLSALEPLWACGLTNTGKQRRQCCCLCRMYISLALLCFSPSPFPSPFPFSAAEWFKAEARHISRQIALEKEATERQEEAVTLRQEVESLQRKLEDLEKERKDVLVRLADATKGHFLATFGPCVHSSKGRLFPV